MTRPALSNWFFAVPVMVISLLLTGLEPALATKGPACLENPALCNEQDPVDQKPYAFWARKPSGKFTKHRVFDMCVVFTMRGYNGFEAMVKGKSRSVLIEQESRTMTS